MYTVINEHKECYTNWVECADRNQAITTAIKANIQGCRAKVFEGTGDNILDRIFPATGAFKHHAWR
jgi:hypothetical protein